MRQADRAAQVAQNQLERGDCYEYFLFAKSLRRTRVCIDLNNQAEAAKRRVGELEQQRQSMLQTGGRSLRDDIIRELANNNCGPAYQQEAARAAARSPRCGRTRKAADRPATATAACRSPPTAPSACRLCDGFYFPVSFSTLPNYFDRDADVCQQKCAAPAELFYHRNPGDAMEQAVSHRSKQTYTSLKTAFRYRKEFIAGCSCKQAEYVPQQGAPDRRADTPPLPNSQAALPPRR